MNLFFWRKPQQSFITTPELIKELEIDIAGLEARRKDLLWMLGNMASIPTRFAEEAVSCAESAARKRALVQQLKTELRPPSSAGDWR